MATVVPAPPATLSAAVPVNASKVALENTAGARNSADGVGGEMRSVPAATCTVVVAGSDATTSWPLPDFTNVFAVPPSVRVTTPCPPAASVCPPVLTANGRFSERILPAFSTTAPVKPSFTSVAVPVPPFSNVPPPESAPVTSDEVVADTFDPAATATEPIDVCRDPIHFFHR